MTYLFKGVDPGWTGAIASLEDIEGEEDAEVHDMPIRDQAGKSRVDCDRVRTLCAPDNPRQRCVAVIEAVGTRPKFGRDPITGKKVKRSEGTVSMIRFGQGQGEVRGILIGLGYRVFEVAPSIWKVKAGLAKMGEKKVCRLAMELFPGAGALFGPKGGALHGRAEALFLAAYGRMLVEGRQIHDR